MTEVPLGKEEFVLSYFNRNQSKYEACVIEATSLAEANEIALEYLDTFDYKRTPHTMYDYVSIHKLSLLDVVNRDNLPKYKESGKADVEADLYHIIDDTYKEENLKNGAVCVAMVENEDTKKYLEENLKEYYVKERLGQYGSIGKDGKIENTVKPYSLYVFKNCPRENLEEMIKHTTFDRNNMFIQMAESQTQHL